MVSLLAKGILLAALLLVILTWPRQPSSWQGPINGFSWQEDVLSVPRLTYQVNLDQEITEIDLNQLLPASCCVAGDRFVLMLTDQATGQAVSAILFTFAEAPSSSLVAAWSNRTDSTNKQSELRAAINSGEQHHLNQTTLRRSTTAAPIADSAYGGKGGYAPRAELARDILAA